MIVAMVDSYLLPMSLALYSLALAAKHLPRALLHRFRIQPRWLILLGFAAHTALVIGRTRAGLTEHGAPLSNWHGWCLAAAWIASCGFLVLTWHRYQAWHELLALPVVIALLALAWMSPPTAMFGTASAVRVWGMIHGTFLLLGTVTAAVGFSAGTMYLVQSSRLKRKLPPFRALRLPSLEVLGRINERLLIWSALLLVSGILAGLFLNWAKHRQADYSLPWNDPTVFVSAILGSWLVASTLFAVLYRPARVGRKVAYLTVASFVFLALTLSIVLFSASRHAAAPELPVALSYSHEPSR